MTLYGIYGVGPDGRADLVRFAHSPEAAERIASAVKDFWFQYGVEVDIREVEE